MYISINSSNEDNTGAGKSMWVNSDIEDLRLSKEPAEHLGSPPWYLEFKGSTYEDRGSGARGGNITSFIKKVEVQLTPADIVVLLNFALKHNLLSLSVKKRNR